MTENLNTEAKFKHKFLPLAVLVTVTLSVVLVGATFSAFSWLRLGASKSITGKLDGYGVIAKVNVTGDLNDADGDWRVGFVSDRNLHNCKLILDKNEMDLSAVRVNTPKVKLWATHYSISSNDIAANEKIEFGQNMDSSSFERTIARPKSVKINCDEGYVRWIESDD